MNIRCIMFFAVDACAFSNMRPSGLHPEGRNNLAWTDSRDYCAHMWIDYKECRTANPFMWRKHCHHEVHGYNKCQYKEFKRRVAIAIEEKRRRGMLTV